MHLIPVIDVSMNTVGCHELSLSYSGYVLPRFAVIIQKIQLFMLVIYRSQISCSIAYIFHHFGHVNISNFKVSLIN